MSTAHTLDTAAQLALKMIEFNYGHLVSPALIGVLTKANLATVPCPGVVALTPTGTDAAKDVDVSAADVQRRAEEIVAERFAKTAAVEAQHGDGVRDGFLPGRRLTPDAPKRVVHHDSGFRTVLGADRYVNTAPQAGA